MSPGAAQGDEIATSPERGTESEVVTGRRLAKLACLLDRDRPLDPEKGSRDQRVCIECFHEWGVAHLEPVKVESSRS
jgi:hypothetical protein